MKILDQKEVPNNRDGLDENEIKSVAEFYLCNVSTSQQVPEFFYGNESSLNYKSLLIGVIIQLIIIHEAVQIVTSDLPGHYN
ncbi:unnamed protein product [Rhizophagus irregularis]|nr:unnamed protein product [Rhizophagus irregularis]